MNPLSRRQFLKAGSVATAGLPFAADILASQAAVKASASKMIAIQIGAVSFVDEGIEQCLDVLQERGAVNTIMPATPIRESGRDNMIAKGCVKLANCEANIR